MIRKLILSLSVFLIVQYGWAQEQKIKLGIGYQIYPYQGTDIKFESGSDVDTYGEFVEGKAEAFNFMIGYRYPLYEIYDNLSVNLHGELDGVLWVEQTSDTQNLQGQTLASGNSGGVFGFQIPVYAAVSYQLGAIDDLSLEGGLGIMYSGINNGIETPFKGSYFPPFYTLAVGYQNFQFKFVQALTKFKDSYPTNGQDIPRLEVKNISFHLVTLF